ncbi:MAG: AraC family transcriptional regulator [Ignavibacteriaceae bacterium]
MPTKTLYIKNMVCGRCIKVVREELENLNFTLTNIELGEATISTTASKDIDIAPIKKVLEENGFELLDDKHKKLVEKIKTIVIAQIQESKNGELEKFNFSKYLSENLNMSYQYLSNLFSSLEDVTIEKFIIHQKIEKVKELLIYDEITLSEISYQLGYSSVQHLSSQFKKVTGFTPSHYKNLKNRNRNPLDKIH